MRHRLLAFLALLLCTAAHAQPIAKRVPVGANRAIDTNYMQGFLRLPVYANSNLGQFLSVDAQGNLKLAQPGGSGGGGGMAYTAGYGLILSGSAFRVDTSLIATRAYMASQGFLLQSNADARYPLLAGSYSNPGWLSSLSWLKLTGTPTSLAGYGITDAVPSSRTVTINGVTQPLSANVNFSVTASGGASALPARVVYLSKSGVPDDANIAFGSTQMGTNGTAAIQAVLDINDNGGLLHVIWDTHTSISSTLIYNGNTEVEFLPGCGLIIRPNSDCSGFLNSHVKFTGAQIDSNVSFHGLGIINGNGYTLSGGAFGAWQQGLGNPTTGQSNLISAIGVKNWTVSELSLLHARVYNATGINVTNGLYDHVTVDVGDPNHALGPYRDGLHWDAGCLYVSTVNCYIKAADDHLALNAIESYPANGGIFGTFYANYVPSPTTGVSLINNYSYGLKGIRFYDRNDARIDGVVIDGYRALVDGYWLIAEGISSSSGLTNLGSITLRNIDAHVTAAYEKPADAAWYSNCDNLTVENLSCNFFDVQSRPKWQFGALGENTLLKHCLFRNYSSVTTSANWGAQFVNRSMTIEELDFENPTVRRQDMQQDAMLLYNEGYIKRLVVNGGSFENIRNVIVNGPGGRIDYIVCNGVKHFSDSATVVNMSSTPIKDIYANGYDGYAMAGGTGAFTSKRGDAFNYPLPVPPSSTLLAGYTPISTGQYNATSDVKLDNGVFSTTSPSNTSARAVASTITIPASASGSFAWKFAADDAKGVVIGLKASSTPTPYNQSPVITRGMSTDGSPYPIYRISDGSNAGQTGNAVIDNFYRMRVDRYSGTTAHVYLETSADLGTTWTVLNQYNDITGAVNFGFDLNGPFKVYYLQTQGFQ